MIIIITGVSIIILILWWWWWSPLLLLLFIIIIIIIIINDFMLLQYMIRRLSTYSSVYTAVQCTGSERQPRESSSEEEKQNLCKDLHRTSCKGWPAPAPQQISMEYHVCYDCIVNVRFLMFLAVLANAIEKKEIILSICFAYSPQSKCFYSRIVLRIIINGRWKLWNSLDSTVLLSCWIGRNVRAYRQSSTWSWPLCCWFK